eukprot:Pgem_evm1s3026
METFAAQYFSQNGDRISVLENQDTAYILAYSCIMLHTDAHNPNVKSKMDREGFVRNNRGINDGKDIDK